MMGVFCFWFGWFVFRLCAGWLRVCFYLVGMVVLCLMRLLSLATGQKTDRHGI
ncbi:hypothetical protein P170DRAFT_81418 [Aspergillus steynii IBT 23096]|uniref:Uncharacterized protein n=1 Tax=Aspergillus steynii IBT 23096 TaxID=1392250 RepID=A0A2I2GFC4_9EURO|nr:uncharacterized protein P170DRAFT_81418 [Aspergillus steynii IBT 23096]PLB51593.1 hypothetical protein P170DRAFT_81418 [Aspergillus steynii IBT 23096]